jgi:hypothetical protein
MHRSHLAELSATPRVSPLLVNRFRKFATLFSLTAEYKNEFVCVMRYLACLKNLTNLF